MAGAEGRSGGGSSIIKSVLFSGCGKGKIMPPFQKMATMSACVALWGRWQRDTMQSLKLDSVQPLWTDGIIVLNPDP